MIPLTLNNINWLLCEVPEGVEGCEIRGMHSLRDYELLSFYGEAGAIRLPHGSYSLPFPVCSKMTEENWREVLPIQWMTQADTVPSYKDYTSEWAGFSDSATRSGHSLLTTNGYKEAILIRVEK